jgi:hypothetical protein
MANYEIYAMRVLYSDVPQRHYRQIVAKSDSGVISFQIFEGTVLQKEPFEHENPDAGAVICRNRDEAIAEVEKEYQASLKSGWHNYDFTID